MVTQFVQDSDAHLLFEIGSCFACSLEWTHKNRDPIREHHRVAGSSFGLRYALIESEQIVFPREVVVSSLIHRGFGFDNDGYVFEEALDVGGQ